MAWVKGEILTALEKERKETRETIESQVSKMLDNINSLHAENMSLKKWMEDKEAESQKELHRLQTNLAKSSRANAPSLGSCAHKDHGEGPGFVKNYTSIISDWSNEDGVGVMDLRTG